MSENIKIKIEIDGLVIELSEEKMEKLYNLLDKIYGPKYFNYPNIPYTPSWPQIEEPKPLIPWCTTTSGIVKWDEGTVTWEQRLDNSTDQNP